MDDPEYLALSLIAQAGYCLRRAGLNLNERQWAESRDTAKGRAEHERVHTQRVEKRGDSVKLYEFTVYSDSMRLLGKCDCIEAQRDPAGCLIPAVDFPVRLYPVEYKHGTVRDEEEYELQLCAQAMCLEEMFHTTILEGALFYISSHRRLPVQFDEALRAKVCAAVEALQKMRAALTVPAAVYGAKCRSCSFLELCMPKVKPSAKNYCIALQKKACTDMGEDL